MSQEFNVEYAVDMTCDGCEKTVKNAVGKLDGVVNLTIDRGSQTIVVQGTVQPSVVVTSLRSVGKTAIVRGAGNSNGVNLGAAVSVLENYGKDNARKIGSPSGLTRFVQISNDTTYLDITFSNMEKGDYVYEIHNNGDLSNVPKSNGGVFENFRSYLSNKILGNPNQITLSADESGAAKRACTIKGLTVQEIVGRSSLIKSADATSSKEIYLSGVIARSAGLFENSKVVCACSGLTLWEEDQEIQKSTKL